VKMLDLFSGIGGASAAMRERGWEVTTVDNNPAFKPAIVADIKDYERFQGLTFDLIWASPPCEEFSREFMPWCKTGVNPSMELVEATLTVISWCKPRFWVIENTRGAVKWFRPLLGPPAWISNPIYLWGVFPPIEKMRIKMGKEKLSSTQAAERGKIPYELSLAVAISIEASLF
jgi:site-specific DNA-cytosine methylase